VNRKIACRANLPQGDGQLVAAPVCRVEERVENSAPPVVRLAARIKGP